MRKAKIKKYSLNLFKIIVTSLFFFLIFDKVDINSTISILLSTKKTFFILALSLMIAELFIANIRWCLVLKQLGLSISFWRAFKYLWIGVFFNQALPSSIGGDAMRGYYLCKKEDYSVSDGAIGVLLDRLIGLLGLILLVFFQKQSNLGIIEPFILFLFLLIRK